MASLQCCAAAAAYATLRRLSAVPPLSCSSTFLHLPPHSSTFRSRNKVRVVVKPRFSPIFASNTNPSKESKDIEASDTSPGPPLLTILAGLVVFSVICWIIGSVVMWLVGLVLH